MPDVCCPALRLHGLGYLCNRLIVQCIDACVVGRAGVAADRKQLRARCAARRRCAWAYILLQPFDIK